MGIKHRELTSGKTCARQIKLLLTIILIIVSFPDTHFDYCIIKVRLGIIKLHFFIDSFMTSLNEVIHDYQILCCRHSYVSVRNFLCAKTTLVGYLFAEWYLWFQGVSSCRQTWRPLT